MSDRIRVYTKPDVRDYDVIVEPGCLEDLAKHVGQHVHAHAYAVIADRNVARLYGERVIHALVDSGHAANLLEFPAGELSKTADQWQVLSARMLDDGIGRDGCVIALGGGVTGDMAGFVAATYMRGIPLVQVPTTLLAMIDASIGGKTGVDMPSGKNLVGAFHQPRVVLVDPQVLRTLPHDELRYGLAEAVKHGAIADPNYLDWIAGSIAPMFEHKTHTLVSLIRRSVELKAHFVSEDVHEAGARAALNFGHTIAHALELTSRFLIPHGHAVGMGMLVEATAGEIAGVTEPGTADHLRHALHAAGLPLQVPAGIDLDSTVLATRTDKKARQGKTRYTLLARIGQIARGAQGEWTMPLADDVVKEALMRSSSSTPTSAPV